VIAQAVPIVTDLAATLTARAPVAMVKAPRSQAEIEHEELQAFMAFMMKIAETEGIA